MTLARPTAEGNALAGLEDASMDWRFRLRGAIGPPPDVAVLALDDRTLAATGRFPVPRQLIAEAIERLIAMGAVQIGIDLLLVEYEGGPEAPGDRAMLEALKRADRPVLAVAGLYRGGPPDPALIDLLRGAALPIVLHGGPGSEARAQKPRDLLVPVPAFRAAGQLGHVNLAIGGGGILRRMPLALPIADLHLPALPLVLAANRLLVGRNDIVLEAGRVVHLGPRRVPIGPDDTLEINHYGPRGSIPSWSLIDLLEGRVGTAAVAGKTVLIGSTATGFGDAFITPYGRDVPGVEVLATVFANLLQQESLVRDRSIEGFGVVTTLALALLAFLAANIRLLGLSVAAMGLLLAGWAVIVQATFAADELALIATEPALAAVLVALAVYAARMRAQRLRALRLAEERANLAALQPPAIAEVVARGDLSLFDDRPLQAAVMFVDIAGSTGLSERLGPDATARFLRRFHTRVEEAAAERGGIVTQFIGDGAMLVFGLSGAKPADAASALSCAHDLLAPESPAAEAEPLRLRIGIHCGAVVATLLGGVRHRQLSVAGDTVNVASRLEQLARTLQTRLAVSDAVVAAARDAGQEALLDGLERIEGVRLRGRAAPIDVWSLRTE